jgi:predicted hydrocarbon binding protein
MALSEKPVVPVTHEKGIIPFLIKSWLMDRFGVDGLEKVMKRLSPQASELLNNYSLSQWYPVELIREMYEAIEDEFSERYPDILKDHGKYGAQRSVQGVLRYLARLLNINSLVQRMGAFWRQYHKGGSIKGSRVVQEGDRKNIVVTVRGYDLGPPGCKVVEGYLVGIVSLAGARNLNVDKQTCIHEGAEACSWLVSWE